MPRFSTAYIDKILLGGEYSDLVSLTKIACSSTNFIYNAVDYGLSPPEFVFVETLNWFAQASRSGVWTYYESAPKERQLKMEQALRKFAPSDFSDWYTRGAADWEDEEKIQTVDEWIEKNHERCTHWLRDFALENRDLFIELGT